MSHQVSSQANTQSLRNNPMFELENHDKPFEPLENSPDLAKHLAVDGWTNSGIQHEAEEETEKYEVKDGNLVYVGTDIEEGVEHHEITWEYEGTVPCFEDAERALFGISYSESAIHTDEDGTPTKMAPGYTMFGHFGTDDCRPIAEIEAKTYTHLGEAVCDMVQVLTLIHEGVPPKTTRETSGNLGLVDMALGADSPDADST